MTSQEEDWGETSGEAEDWGDTKDVSAGAQDWGQMEWSADLEEEEPSLAAGQGPATKKQRIVSDSALRTDLVHVAEKEEVKEKESEAASALRSGRGRGLIWRLPGDVLAEIGGLLLLNEFRLWTMTDKRSTTFQRNAPIVHIDHGLRGIFSRPPRWPVASPAAPAAPKEQAPYAVGLRLAYAVALENVLDCISKQHVDHWKTTPWSRLHSLEISHFEKPADLSLFSALMATLFAGIQERKATEAKLSRRVEPFRKLVIRVPSTAALVVNRMIEYKLDGPTEELALTDMDAQTLKRLQTHIVALPKKPTKLELNLAEWNTMEMAASLTAILVTCPSVTSLTVTLSPQSAFYLPAYEFTTAMDKMNKRELRELVVTSNLTGRSQATWDTLQKACPKLQHFRVDDAPFEPEYSGTWYPVILYWNPRELPTLFRPKQLRVWLLQGNLFDAQLADKICREYKNIRDVRVVGSPIAIGDRFERKLVLEADGNARTVLENRPGHYDLDNLEDASDIPWHTFALVFRSSSPIEIADVSESSSPIELADYWRLEKAKSFLSAHLITLVRGTA
jgi:hypothetical protein